MKVKLFWKTNPVMLGTALNASALEDEINAWLSENPRIKMIDIKQSSSGGSLHGSVWFVSVWYEEEAG